MGIFTKRVYEAGVHYYGEVDEDPEVGSIRAWVKAKAPPEITPGRNALAYIIPASCGFHLYLASQSDPRFCDALSSLSQSVAERVLVSEEAAQGFSCSKEQLDVRDFAGSSSVAPLPTQIQESEGKSTRVWSAAVTRDRQGQLGTKTSAPLGGGQAYFSCAASFELLEYATRQESYEDTVVPAAAGLLMVAKLWDALGGADNELGEEVQAYLGAAATRFVSAEDPRHEIAESKQDEEGLLEELSE